MSEKFPPSYYGGLSLDDKIEVALEFKHFSLESGCDANVEIFHKLLPESVKQLRLQSAKISQLEEKLRVATDFIESRKCKTYLGIAPPGKEVSVHSHDCPKCKTLSAIKEKNEKTI